MKKNDIILILIILVISGAGLFVLHATKSSGSFVKITVDGNVVATYDLSVNQTYELEGYEGGYNILVIENGEAYFREADCPDLVCVKSGKIHKVGETIVCLPHRVVAEIVNEGEDAEVDTVSQ
ncbi:MAG: NusG domain II-containing protein [Lachnospiraceae bacterium]|nr:NusG domain II-containing protein [Lachnospiraceae bacterium]